LIFLKDLAKELRAEVCCEGEPLIDDSTVAAAPYKAILGLLFVVLTAPFLLA
jgi:hypothetical protein